MSAPLALPRAGPGRVIARRDEVTVWRGTLAPAPADAARGLSPEECAFASRLRFGAAGWTAARCFLRRVLGAYLGCAPRAVPLVRDASGKPGLGSCAEPALRFNLSHAGGVALVAVRLGHEVGVDVEELRGDVDVDAVAREVFTAGERAALAGCPAPDRRAAFFRAWARREALGKALGIGIGVAVPPPSAAGTRLLVRDVEGIAGHAAAVASEGVAWRVRLLGGAREDGHADTDPR